MYIHTSYIHTCTYMYTGYYTAKLCILSDRLEICAGVGRDFDVDPLTGLNETGVSMTVELPRCGCYGETIWGR